ncbi:response regulator [Neobacillus mesonae]|uniref:Histidine kinase n=1 Tax=Neobacillus mesonae TaxID=1193713 RepID=A0A3Q9QX54_9BACI|nr:response regulator [Neobacillus mesonae]AZU64243.1 histidine kinase [Neobacillus mesonae]
MRYFIVDDDKVCRTMLKKIISDSQLGMVIGEAENGSDALSSVMSLSPDIVLIDCLMPEMDGIEAMEQLRRKGFSGQFIMISQIVNKEMVGEAYEKGVEFFIHKPINRVEVESILKRTAEQARLKDSLQTIRQSLEQIGLTQNPPTRIRQSVKDIVLSILNQMGVVGEAGSEDITAIIEFLIEMSDRPVQLPPLKDLYEAAGARRKVRHADMKKECKAIEQRIRRTILSAINNLASLGAIDFTNEAFEYFAPRYFDFQEVRTYMVYIRDERQNPPKIKIHIRKFLQVLYLETLEKYRG